MKGAIRMAKVPCHDEDRARNGGNSSGGALESFQMLRISTYSGQLHACKSVIILRVIVNTRTSRPFML